MEAYRTVHMRQMKRRGRRRGITCSTLWKRMAKHRFRRLPSSSTFKLTVALIVATLIAFSVVALRSRKDTRPIQTESDSFVKVSSSRWYREQRCACGARFTVYGGEFARLRGDVIVDQRHATARRRGGERLESVLFQSEDDELYRLTPGFFRMWNCGAERAPPAGAFHIGNYLNDWLAVTRLETGVDTHTADRMIGQFTITLTRREYANLYHTMSDWYNAFLLKQFFNVTSTVHVLLVDAHPEGPLDAAWHVLFPGGVWRLSDLDTTTSFTELVWSIPGHRGPLEQHNQPRLLLVNQFTRFVLNSFEVNWMDHHLDCSSISLLLIRRHNYVTHVRNSDAVVRRKIINENQLENELRRRNPNFRIRSIRLEELTMRDQLRMICSTDVLIGMHGAGLTHALFLPSRSGVVEMIPASLSGGNRHFQAIARWRHLEYARWTSQRLEDDSPSTGYTTYVPPDAIDKLLKRIVHRLCPKS